jgi:hypothetical protein
MSESDWLLYNIIEGGDFVGGDDAGRMVIVLAIEPRDFETLLTFGAVEVESECGGDDEPYECTPMSPCWFFGSRAPVHRDSPALGACTGA